MQSLSVGLMGQNLANLLVPDENGVLVPCPHEGNDAPLSAQEREISLAINGGGSGEGMSHYSQASRCGRRARLSTARYESFKAEGRDVPATKNHFIIGSVYHRLHELARTEDAGPPIDLSEVFTNPNVAEGARLYRGWLRTWGKDYWGKCLGVEVHLSDNETFVSAGDFEQGDGDPNPINVTGAIDMVVEMDAEACERAKQRGLELEPGRRLVDWKTADGTSDGSQYAGGLQAIWYCHLWNRAHPDAQVDGIIFDVVMKRSRRKDRAVHLDDFQAFYVPCGLEPVDVLRGMVLQGHRNIVEDVPNRSECVSWRGEVCPFRTNGECDAI